ncbi:hypothetical protein [Fusibacter ferrireducens]|uniref:Transcriptional regulator n=1 Tax=Fusibacter ferrireducens TaxID=2785058 RepID=A0ABR9ZSX6_9FIRM|nr:hypothetical protein [Fusibacter ferrireducens]MBF4693545.1 hypothetical protein [Fusibacter ferrireducens]
MKIGFLGSKIRVNDMKKIFSTLFTNITPIFIIDNFVHYQEHVEQEIKAIKATLDGFIFLGELQYEHYSYILSPDIPCVYLKKDWSSLQIAFLKVSIRDIDFRNVSIDSYTSSELQHLFSDLDISDSENNTHFITRRRFDKTYVSKVFEEHLLLYKSNTVRGCVTALHPVYDLLKGADIPCIYVKPSAEAIIKTVNAVVEQINTRKNTIGHTAILIIKIIPKKEYSYVRKDEYLYMHEKIKVAEEIYYFARNTKAAVVSESNDKFIILMNKSDLFEYTQGFQCFYLVHSINANTNCDVNIGIGYGFDPSEAKHNANIAIDRLSDSIPNLIYIVPYENSVIGPLEFLHAEFSTEKRVEEKLILEISSKTGISQTLLYDLYILMEKQKKNSFTSPELSKNLGISQRSSNRLLLKLEESNYAVHAGKQLTGKSGRPSDIYEITLTKTITS